MNHLSRLGCRALRSTTVTRSLGYNTGKLATTDDGIIVALHRDQEFPYEHTKPLPLEDSFQESTLISDRICLAYESQFYPRGPSVPDICNMFYVHKKMLYTHSSKTRIDSTVPETPSVRKGL
uniref:Large ribosomal subunit protein mL42 n=1 Tax=Trichuris muris TaxID=70415 RepID=A0A5S6R186_TRIMR